MPKLEDAEPENDPREEPSVDALPAVAVMNLEGMPQLEDPRRAERNILQTFP